MDVARFGDWITPAYTREKVRENYQRRFSVGYPNEELPVMRPFQTTPAYQIWDAQGAVFGAHYGMEAVNYFALPGEPRWETPSFRRSNAFEATAQECRAVREAVGIWDRIVVEMTRTFTAKLDKLGVNPVPLLLAAGELCMVKPMPDCPSGHSDPNRHYLATYVDEEHAIYFDDAEQTSYAVAKVGPATA